MTAHVLVGVDGSEGSRHALAWALGEAQARHWQVEAVMVWQLPYNFGEGYYPVDEQRLAADAAERLATALAEVAGNNPPVEINPVVLEGAPAETLCERSRDAELLVLGSRGLGRFSALLLGSVSGKCAHHSNCPVVIVPTP